MQEINIVIKNLVGNIRGTYFDKTPEKVAEANARFYEIKKQLELYSKKLPKFSDKQYENFRDGMRDLVMLDYRHVILPDLLDVIKRLNVYEYEREALTGFMLLAAIFHHHSELEQKCLETLPEKSAPVENSVNYHYTELYTSDFHLAAYYLVKGDMQKAEQHILIWVSQKYNHNLRWEGYFVSNYKYYMEQFLTAEQMNDFDELLRKVLKK